MALQLGVATLLVSAMPSLAQDCSGEWRSDGVQLVDVQGNGTGLRVHCVTTWDPDGPGPGSARLVIGGEFYVPGEEQISNIAVWDGTSAHALGQGFSRPVYALTTYRGDLIAGGWLPGSGVQRWDGASWSPVGSLPNFNPVRAFAEFHDELIVGGSGGLVRSLAAWNGSTWRGIAPGIDGEVRALAVHNGQLITGGTFSEIGGQSMTHVASWDGSTWRALGSGLGSIVNALTVFNGEIVAAGGAFSFSNGRVSRVARWNGAEWAAMGHGWNGSREVEALAVYRGDLFAVGGFNAASNGICRWDGSAWRAVSAGVNGDVHAAVGFENDLIIGGEFNFPGNTQQTVLGTWRTNQPVLSQQPVSQRCDLHGNIALAVLCSGTEPFEYLWRRDGTALTDGETSAGGLIEGARSRRMTVTNAQVRSEPGGRVSDSGLYDCVVTNVCGSAVSSVAQVRVRCPADVDDGTGSGAPDDAVTIEDLLHFLNIFAAGLTSADVDDGSGTGLRDGGITIEDLLFFLERLELGC